MGLDAERAAQAIFHGRAHLIRVLAQACQEQVHVLGGIHGSVDGFKGPASDAALLDVHLIPHVHHQRIARIRLAAAGARFLIIRGLRAAGEPHPAGGAEAGSGVGISECQVVNHPAVQAVFNEG